MSSVTFSFYLILGIILLEICSSRSYKSFVIKLFITVIVLEINQIHASAFILFGKEINVDEIVLFALFVACIPLLRNRLNRKILVVSTLFFSFACLSVVCNCLIPYEGEIVPSSVSWDHFFFGIADREKNIFDTKKCLTLIRVLIFCIVAVSIISVFEKKDYLICGTYVIFIGKIHIIYALIDYILKSIFHSDLLSRLFQSLFVNFNEYYSGIVSRDGTIMIKGLTLEGSYFALAMFMIALVILLYWRYGYHKKQLIVWFVAALLLLILSGAFSSIWLLLILAVLSIWAFGNGGKSPYFWQMAMIAAFVFMLVILMVVIVYRLGFITFDSFYGKKIVGILESVGSLLAGNYSAVEATQGMPRMISIVECLKYFLASPLLGLGPGAVNPWSGLVALLANYGLVGFILWLYLITLFARIFSTTRRVSLLMVFVVISIGTFMFQENMVYWITWVFVSGLASALESDYISGSARKKISASAKCTLIAIHATPKLG